MTIDHDHGIKCTGCDVAAGECCRHCPAAADAAEAAARPNARMRTAALEVLELADRAGVTISFTTYASADDPGEPRMIHVLGRSGERHMLLTDALRIALRGRDMDRIDPSPNCPHTGIEFSLPLAGTRVTVICEPTWEQFVAAGLRAVSS
jgi:hypothetical protein